jgi:hypothetical protein
VWRVDVFVELRSHPARSVVAQQEFKVLFSGKGTVESKGTSSNIHVVTKQNQQATQNVNVVSMRYLAGSADE